MEVILEILKQLGIGLVAAYIALVIAITSLLIDEYRTHSKNSHKREVSNR